nr:conserved hypothetical protein [Vibrio chagasii]
MYKKITDLKLLELLCPTVTDLYSTGVEFEKTNPDYSLVKFRDVTDALISKLEEKYQIDRAQLMLVDRINQLHDGQIISSPLKHTFHTLRGLGNLGAHLKMNSEIKTNNSDPNTSDDTQAESIEDKATRARKTLVSAMEDVYLTIYGSRPAKEIEYISFKQQEVKNVIFDAIFSDDHKVKFKGGMVFFTSFFYDFEHGIKKTYAPHEQAKRQTDRQTAMGLINEACVLSANIEKYKGLSLSPSELEKIICERSETEYLLRYSVLILTNEKKGSEIYNLGYNRLVAAAQRGNVHAQTELGALLTNDDITNELGVEMLTKAANEGISQAHLNLFDIHIGKATKLFNEDKALAHLNKAAELEHPEALHILGLVTLAGEMGVERSEERAKELIKQAADLGDRDAQLFFVRNFTDAPNKFNEAIEGHIKRLIPKPVVRSAPKIKPNDLCPCDSGKKYKKCCKEKEFKTNVASNAVVIKPPTRMMSMSMMGPQ